MSDALRVLGAPFARGGRRALAAGVLVGAAFAASMLVLAGPILVYEDVISLGPARAVQGTVEGTPAITSWGRASRSGRMQGTLAVPVRYRAPDDPPGAPVRRATLRLPFRDEAPRLASGDPVTVMVGSDPAVVVQPDGGYMILMAIALVLLGAFVGSIDAWKRAARARA